MNNKSHELLSGQSHHICQHHGRAMSSEADAALLSDSPFEKSWTTSITRYAFSWRACDERASALIIRTQQPHSKLRTMPPCLGRVQNRLVYWHFAAYHKGHGYCVPSSGRKAQGPAVFSALSLQNLHSSRFRSEDFPPVILAGDVCPSPGPWSYQITNGHRGRVLVSCTSPPCAAAPQHQRWLRPRIVRPLGSQPKAPCQRSPA